MFRVGRRPLGGLAGIRTVAHGSILARTARCHAGQGRDPAAVMLHRAVTPSWLAVARILPFGLNATDDTLLLLPGLVRVAMRRPVATSQR